MVLLAFLLGTLRFVGVGGGGGTLADELAEFAGERFVAGGEAVGVEDCEGEEGFGAGVPGYHFLFSVFCAWGGLGRRGWIWVYLKQGLM